MLVLSRKKDEEFLFPQLGISVKVVDTGSKTVRIGIDAPREIRVVRSELDLEPDAKTVTNSGPSDNRPLSSQAGSESMKNELSNRKVLEQIDQANLAIHLAQNQLRQGLVENAEQALQDAIACLCAVETGVVGYSAESVEPAESFEPVEYATSLRESNGYTNQDCSTVELAVNEAQSKYMTSRTAKKNDDRRREQIALDVKNRLALEAARAKRQLDWVAKNFRQAGLNVVVDDVVDMVHAAIDNNNRSVDFSN